MQFVANSYVRYYCYYKLHLIVIYSQKLTNFNISQCSKPYSDYIGCRLG